MTDVIINNLLELAEDYCYSSSDGCEDRAHQLLEKSLFKYTSCGVSFWRTDNGVSVCGYCEGSDVHIEPHNLTFPFNRDEFSEAVEKADLDGCDAWNQTHGCEECSPEGGLNQYGDEFQPGEVGGPVNPDCSGCKGHGIIL